MSDAVERAVAKSIVKEWKRIERKYGSGSAFASRMYELDERGKEDEIEKRKEEVISILKNFKKEVEDKLQKTHLQYWRNRLQKIVKEVDDLIKFYDGF